MPCISRRLIPAIALGAIFLGAQAAPAFASASQESLMQDDGLLHANPDATLQTMHDLGVTRVKVGVYWGRVAPTRPPHGFDGANPAAYPAANWAIYDQIVQDAKKDGISVAFELTGPAPTWASGRGEPAGGLKGVWRPSASQFGAFARAIGTRYSGHYQGLPRVSFWTIWNEPNYGPSLAPQARAGDTIELSPAIYRGLVDAAWGGLHAAGHSRDAFLIGETAPRGFDHPIGDFSGMKPLRFLRALYCVDSRYRQLRGSAAAARGCPTNGAGSRRFARAHAALFKASGFAQHPYEQGTAPNLFTYGCRIGGRQTFCASRTRSDPEYADLPTLPRLMRVLDRLNRTYGSHTRFSIWNTEYGYFTNPPRRDAKVSPDLAAVYINQAEYISYKQSRIASYSQYLLQDPAPPATYVSGLKFSNGREKATYDPYRLPLFLPSTTGRRGRALEVWGGVRGVSYDGPQSVQIQFRSGSSGAFSTLKTLTVGGRRGYFDIRQVFPASGSVQLTWTTPGGAAIHSRIQKVTIR
jgi:hypothetical protein